MDKGAHQDIHCIYRPTYIYSTTLVLFVCHSLQLDLK